MNGYVDAHCHLGQYSDPVGTLEAASRAGVVTIAVTESPDEYRRLRTRFGDRTGLRLALGAHPLKADLLTRQLARFERLLLDTAWVGEVGLDYSAAYKSSAAVQRHVFESILAMPQMRHKVVTVHSRRAERDTIAMLADSDVAASLHWWTGPPRLIDSAVEAASWFSVNSSMFRSSKGRAAIAAMPRERVVTETDGPFSGSRANPASPTDIPKVVSSLAAIWRTDPEEARAQVWKNMVALRSSARNGTTLPPTHARPDR